tara:strand:- start:879 stop:1076 length:198 start_codon:yes stop_codon:yes gene_type:complete
MASKKRTVKMTKTNRGGRSRTKLITQKAALRKIKRKTGHPYTLGPNEKLTEIGIKKPRTRERRIR